MTTTFYATYSPVSAGGFPVTVTNASVAPTGNTVPLDATYIGLDNGGDLIGAVGDNSGRIIAVGAGTAGTATGGVVTVQGVASMTPVQVSQATASNLNATVIGAGTAGTANAGVVTVQGIASMTPVQVSQATASNLNATVVGAGTAGTANAGVVTVQGIASMTPLLVTQSGSGTQQPVNVAQFGGSNVVTGTGAGGSGVPRVTVSNDSTVGLVASSAIVGKVGIDQTTPGTTNATQATSGTAATWQAEGAIAAASVTSSYATILTPSSNTKIVMMRNNTNQPIGFSFDAGTTTNFVLDSGDQVAIDYIANGIISPTTAIQVKYTGSAPTTGNVRVNACH